MIYLYALCPSLAAFPEPPVGIGEAEVEVLTVEPLGAVIERDVDVAQLKANDAKLMEAVLAHDRVLGHFFLANPPTAAAVWHSIQRHRFHQGISR